MIAPRIGRHLALTIDMDGPALYRGLHGLEGDDEDALVMYRAPLERFARLCAEMGGPGTIFVIARDVERGAHELLRPLVERGFEVASHSYAHDYHMSRWAPAAAHEDLAQAKATLERTLGVAPVGFRAPGYHLSAAMLDGLEALGFRYDSSVLASPPYYAAKASVLGLYRVLGRRSSSLLGGPAITLAPTTPYRPGPSPYVRGSRAIWELPLAVTRRLRLPVTAASLVLAPAPLRTRMIDSLKRTDVVVINMHAMDFADAAEIDPRLRRHQPELERPADERLRILVDACRALTAERAVSSCARIAELLEATGTPAAA
jgi:peptidoglycan-N-acetylglucosamine deacetylase